MSSNIENIKSQTTDLILTEQHYDLINQIKRINNKLKDSFNNFIQIGYELSKIKKEKSYELLYTHLVNGKFEKMVGLFIKEGHFRFYEDYIEKYNHKTKSFEIIFQLSSEVSSLLNLFKDLFNEAFVPYYSNEETNKLTINRPRIDMFLTLLNNTDSYNQFS